MELCVPAAGIQNRRLSTASIISDNNSSRLDASAEYEQFLDELLNELPHDLEVMEQETIVQSPASPCPSSASEASFASSSSGSLYEPPVKKAVSERVAKPKGRRGRKPKAQDPEYIKKRTSRKRCNNAAAAARYRQKKKSDSEYHEARLQAALEANTEVREKVDAIRRRRDLMLEMLLEKFPQMAYRLPAYVRQYASKSKN